MKNRIVPLILFVVLLNSSALVFSETEEAIPAALNLDAILLDASQKNPDILAAKADWLAMKKRVWIDSSLPDPMGGYDIMGAMTETRLGPQKNRFMVSQEVPFPLKLVEKGKMANDDARAAYQRYLAVARNVANQLTKLYDELYFIDASLETLDSVKGLLKKFEQVAQSRYSNMSGEQRDVAKAQAEVSMSLEKIFMLKRDREIVAAMINALLDRDPMLPVGKASPPPSPVLSKSLIDLVNLAVQNRQEIKEMEALASKSRRAKTLAKLAYIPDINVGFEYTRVGSGSTEMPPDMDGRDSWMFPVRFNIPLWQNRIIPEIQEAKNRAEADAKRLLGVKNKTFYEVKEAFHRYKNSTEVASLYETAVIPQAELALSADQAGYEAGKTDFLNLLDSERVYLNAKLSHVQFFTEALKAYADLVRATGLDFEGGKES